MQSGEGQNFFTRLREIGTGFRQRPRWFIAFCRLAVLGSRFILQIAISRLIGVEAVGVYGLVVATTAILPVATGFGLHFKMNRRMILLERAQSLALFRDRMLVLCGAQAICAIGFAFAMAHILHFGLALTFVIAALAFLETVLFEVCLSLTSISETVLANILIFCRFALWVPAFCISALLAPRLRSIDFLMECWLVGSVCACAILIAVGRKWPWREARAMPRDFGGLRSDLSQSIAVYFSDLGNAGVGYADRLIVGSVLGLVDTGIYTFFWSFANALQTLSLSTLVQPALPNQVLAAREGPRRLNQAVASLAKKVAIFNLGMTVIIVIFAAITVFYFTGQPVLAKSFYVLPVLMICTTLRALGDVVASGIYARGADRSWVISNVLSCTITIAVAWISSTLYGLFGVAVGAVVSAIAILLVKVYLFKRVNC